MAAQVAQGSPLAQELQNIVQPKLIEVGWSSDDTTLSEYIVLMLANGKDKDQVAQELASDLLNLEPGDNSANEFTQWLFEQVAALTGQAAASQAAQAQADNSAAPPQAIPSAPVADPDSGMEIEQTHSIPTGPKSMRNGGYNNTRGNSRRQVGLVNKTLDRANDSVLHKVRNNSSERIGRGSPRWLRGGLQGAQFAAGQGLGRGGRGAPNQQMSNQQQNQLMQFMSQQMEMMQQVLSGQNPQSLMNGVNGMTGAAINPHFRGRPADRGGRGGGKFGDRKSHQQNGAQNSPPSGDTEMGGEGMDTEIITQSKPVPDGTICKFNLKCTKADCAFVHQSPAAPPNTTIDLNDVCSFGASCTNPKCVGKHPSPAQRTAFQGGQECKFWPNCTNHRCPFKHPDMPMCKFGGDCSREDCKFTHIRTMCKYSPCMNPKCHFKHAEGQKKSPTWSKDNTDGDSKMSGEHVSERKFTTGEGEEELIKPGATDGQQEDADLVT